jgi:hypothetical protein
MQFTTAITFLFAAGALFLGVDARQVHGVSALSISLLSLVLTMN